MITNQIQNLRSQIKSLIILFIIGIMLSGITAFPIESQLAVVHQLILSSGIDNLFTQWIELVYSGVRETNSRFPFMGYGTDWLAFAHIVIGLAFIGPLRDPVKNIWIIEWSMISCIAVFPLAFIAGAIRGIPFWWQLIDCSFGIFGGLLLGYLYRKIKSLEKLQTQS